MPSLQFRYLWARGTLQVARQKRSADAAPPALRAAGGHLISDAPACAGAEPVPGPQQYETAINTGAGSA